MNSASRKWTCWAVLLVATVALCAPQAQAATKLLRLRLDGQVAEAPQEMDFLRVLSGGGGEPHTLRGLLDLVDRAAHQDDIAGLVLIIEQPMMSLAQAEELTRALHAFRETGKKIHVYMDHAGNLSYALACAGNDITIAEHSELAIVGLNGSMSFYKGLLDKIGVQADMLHCGAYKSAVEPFTRTEPSKEAEDNINWLLDGIFARWLEMMAAGRGLSEAEIHAAVDNAPLHSEKALELKLVDSVSSFPAFKQMLYKEYGRDVEVLKKLEQEDELKLDFDNPFAIFELFGKIMEKTAEPAKPGLALIFIEGGIAMGRNEPDLLGGGTSAGSSTLRAAFEEAREDDNVKAVVVRVNSPGGSALASDIIWEAATRCAKEKPLVVSMGGVAGSGGYYVAIPGDVIFAERCTLTGSIGVLGGKFVWRELMEGKLGITTTEFSRGQRAGIMSMNRTWNDEERAWMQGYIDSIYTQFKDRVMASRGSRIKGNLEDLAGGRVYTGEQALKIGLVDKIGGLTEAIDYAIDKASLEKDCEIYVLPRPVDIVEIFKQLIGEETGDEFEISLGARSGHDALLGALLPALSQLAPERTREILQDLQNVVILNRERVGCFMPFINQPR
ncbi:MAG: signal peptide peptidase SppA [Phycisphaerae bacterium]|jgi:protease-4